MDDDIRFDVNKIDDTVLALLWLTQCGDGRAWKGHDWDTLGRLHEKGMIHDPVGRAKSVSLTPEGLVDASFSGGVLTLQADDQPNEIVVWAEVPANKLNVSCQ